MHIAQYMISSVVHNMGYVLEAMTCWRYKKDICNGLSYLKIKKSNKKYRADVAAYKQFLGPIKVGYSLKRVCDTKFCINPLHQKITRKRNHDVLLRKKDMEDKAEKYGLGLIQVNKDGDMLLKPIGYDRRKHSGDDYCRMLEEQIKAAKEKLCLQNVMKKMSLEKN